jgi:hypothetical protein
MVLMLFAALLAPVLEAFDRWDATPCLAGDTEFHVAALAISAGLLAAVAVVALRIRVRLAFHLQVMLCASDPAIRITASLPFFPGNSPPDLPLRI